MIRKATIPQLLTVPEIAIVTKLEDLRKKGVCLEKYDIANEISNNISVDRRVVQALFDRMVSLDYIVAIDGELLVTGRGLAAFRHTASILKGLGFITTIG